MKIVLVFALLFIGVTLAPAAESKAAGFVGKYEAAGRGKSFLSLEVISKGEGFEVSFSAGNEDGSGAAPDGGGPGKLNARGELKFSFEDSFGNKGHGVLKRAAKGYVVTIEATPIDDPRAAVHYGERRLQRLALRAPKRIRG